jgi:hypothetical protein
MGGRKGGNSFLVKPGVKSQTDRREATFRAALCVGWTEDGLVMKTA